jgi:nitrite reductase/ring-hydroxylating ferredoxin subunit
MRLAAKLLRASAHPAYDRVRVSDQVKSELVRVGSAESVPPGTSKAFTLGRYDVAVFNVDGTFYALENACPHQGGPIADGYVEALEVTCPWHAWCFDLRTGKMTLGDFAVIPRFAVHADETGLFLSAEPLEEA